MPDIKIRVADEAAAIAAELIPAHHEHLERARILYLFTTQKRKQYDRVKLATAGKLAALHRFLASGKESVEKGHDFIVLLGWNEWHGLTEPQRRALVDHELCHCVEKVAATKKGVLKRRWSLRAHDLEEFRDVLQRHGFWKTDVRAFGELARQLDLPEASGGVKDREPVGTR